MKYSIILIAFLLVNIITPTSYAQTTVEKNGNQWELLVDGKPFEIKGATFQFVDDVENYDKHFKDLKFLGVNSIRTWATGKNTKALLDAAYKHDIKVMAGIWMRHGRPGMEDDDSFNYLEDTEGMQDQYENAINFVKEHKDHPAVLTWGIANEVYLNIATDPEKEAYSKLLEKICKEVKRIDPNHPISSTEAWTFGFKWWQKYVPSLDIYGLNSYGYGANFLQEELNKANIDKPYVLTEFGVTGEWDIKQEVNGVKVEPSDGEKYDAIAKGYSEWIANKPNNLGAYVFHYGNDKTHLAPWLLMFYEGQTRPQYWATRKAYTNQDPVNWVPEIQEFGLSKSEAKSKIWVPVSLDVSDKENDELEFSFSYNHRKGSRKRRDQILSLNHRGDLKNGFEVQLPEVDGPTKIYVKVKDAYNNLGIASTGIIINDKKARKNKFLVPKAELPFFVYKDSENLPYAASGYMGDYKYMDVDIANTEDVHSGKTAIKMAYNSKGGWFGLAFQDPANDWGDILGGYDISGAKTFSFWAKASKWNVKARIGFGLIEKDKPFPDSAKKLVEIELERQWTRHTITLKKEDLRCIRSGFVIFGGGNGSEYEIYLDDIVFE